MSDGTSTTATATTATSKRRRLSFATEDAVLADVARLRRHGYRRHGNWSLPQIAWHLAIPLENYLTPLSSPDVKPTPEQAKLFSQIGRDPIWAAESPNGVLTPADVANASRTEAGLWLEELGAVASSVAGVETTWDTTRKRWYADVLLPGPAWRSRADRCHRRRTPALQADRRPRGR